MDLNESVTKNNPERFIELVVKNEDEPGDTLELSLFTPLTDSRLLMNHPGLPLEVVFPGGVSKSSLKTVVCDKVVDALSVKHNKLMMSILIRMCVMFFNLSLLVCERIKVATFFYASNSVG